MTRFKFFANYEKEEAWLGQMARQGLQLHGVTFAYHFHTAAPEEAIFRIDCRMFKTGSDFAEYGSLFEDSGWLHVAGTKSSGAQYFKKIGSAGDADIFSDSASRAGRYQRLSHLWLTLSIFFLPLFVALMASPQLYLERALHPKALYLTPGLWEMSGFAFWRSFLFETPFALLRGYAVFLWLALLLLYVFFAAKAHWRYQNTLRKGAES